VKRKKTKARIPKALTRKTIHLINLLGYKKVVKVVSAIQIKIAMERTEGVSHFPPRSHGSL
jgi:hypothetical protein